MPAWCLEREGQILPPRVYSQGAQDTLIEDIISELKHKRIVLLHGAVGTGKSAIALHLVKHYGNGIIQTPTKVLEEQYKNDYGYKKLCVRVSADEVLKIETFKGRNNFICPFRGVSCDNPALPCRVRTTQTEQERNEQGQARRVQRRRYRRIDIARTCPYWAPIVGDSLVELYIERLEQLNRHVAVSEYQSVSGTKYFIQQLDEGICPFYNQFSAYLKNNVAMLMNSALWEIETLSGRKKAVEIEIIDEADAWLDNLAFKVVISQRKLSSVFETAQRDAIESTPYINSLIRQVDADFKEATEREYTEPINALHKELLDNWNELLQLIGRDDPRISVILSTSDAYVCSTNSTRDRRLTFYIPEPALMLKRLLANSANRIVLMSATFQSFEVLRDIYELDFGYCQGETQFPGTVYLMETGEELTVNHGNWQHSEFRNRYYRLRDRIVREAAKPRLIQVWGKKYAAGVRIKRANILEDSDEDWSTTTSRGIDLPGDKCRSIIILKYPYPDLSDPVLMTLKERLKHKFWKYYEDIARRNLIQQIGRAVRTPEDWCELWSPDAKVLEATKRIWSGKIICKRMNGQKFTK